MKPFGDHDDYPGRASIPPIEIGSFAALQPDKSEFIGSASGVFFVNTVFRAFAAATAGSDLGDQSGEHTAPDPGSAHSYVTTGENTQTQGPNGISASKLSEIDLEDERNDSCSYGVAVPGLGCPPSPASVQKLLMRYFRDWHPYFPFLHGPTFFKEVDQFFSQESNDHASAHVDSGSKLAQVVTFQCIFNIAASRSDDLEGQSRIQSTSALMGVLGSLSSKYDIQSLQALLAVELYLITAMSLRAASTVHGTLVRMLYHIGLHRCPFRFVQLPRPMCDLRKRVFWSAYVLDRFLSQALGHPTAIRDDEVDVCTPSMPELHKPVKPREKHSMFEPGSEEEVREHLPAEHSGHRQISNLDTAESNEGDARLESTSPSFQSPANHHHIAPEAAGGYVQGYLVTYSRILGSSLDLLHKSIHKRSITWDKVLEITYQTHAWWNSLPSALQEKSVDDGHGTTAFGYFFELLYHYLIIFINRPFLSLPTYTVEFRSSLQSALSASRSILSLRLHERKSSSLAWPGTLSAMWMSGLVIAYATLLDLFPLEKAKVDLHQCFDTLEGMETRWPSARQCRVALKKLSDRLALGMQYRPTQIERSRENAQAQAVPGLGEPSAYSTAPTSTAQPNSKRRRYDEDASMLLSGQPPNPTGLPSLSFEMGLSGMRDWQPVLEYTGPDFGFDASQLANDDWQTSLNTTMSSDPSGALFNNPSFDAYVQYFGNNLNF